MQWSKQQIYLKLLIYVSINFIPNVTKGYKALELEAHLEICAVLQVKTGSGGQGYQNPLLP